MAALLLVLVVLLGALGGVLGLIALLAGRPVRALRWFGATSGLVIAYLVVLGAVGLGSRPQVLALGEPKCFDDWCATVKSVQPAAADRVFPSRLVVGDENSPWHATSTWRL